MLTRRELPAPTEEPEVSFIRVLEARRSARSSQDLPDHKLAELLWHGARVRETGAGRLGLSWQRRAAPSSGGLHPIHLFIRKRGSDEIQLYDPVGHALLSVAIRDKRPLLALDDQVTAAAPRVQGPILIFVADTNRTTAAYEHVDSLVWRDAGAFAMTLQLVAEYLNFAYCPIGVLGTTVVDALGLPTGWLAAGTSVVGSRVETGSESKD